MCRSSLDGLEVQTVFSTLTEIYIQGHLVKNGSDATWGLD